MTEINLNINKKIEDFFIELGDISRFTAKTVRQFSRKPFEIEEIAKQLFEFGNKSLPLIGVTAFILGLVFTVQTRPVLVKVGAEAWLPGMVFVSIIREIGPVITALIFAGKVGSGIGAELGSMKVTEQIDAMEVSGTNPMKFLVATRVISSTLIVPALVIFADFISLIGSYLGANISGKISFRLFYTMAFEEINYFDFIPATIKTFFFGFAIGLISCYKGYRSHEGTKGVGKAANSAVVVSSLAIFVIDLIAVQLTELLI